MPYVASESTASNAVFQQTGRQSFADRASARSGRNFDDLLNAIPDAPPEPPAPSRAEPPAPERRTAPEPRATTRDDRQASPRSADNADRGDQRSQATDNAAKSTDDAPAQTAPQGKTDKTTSDAIDGKKAAKDDTAQPAKDADASASAQGTVVAAAQQVATPEAVTAVAAVVVDPVAAAAVAVDASATAGDAATGGKAAAAIAAAAAAGAGKATEQTAAAPATAGTELTADDADALAALAAKAQQGLKDAQDAKAGKPGKGDTKAAAGDKPADAAKSAGNPLAALDPNAAQPASGDAKAAAATPGSADLAKAVAGHQGGKADTDAKPATHVADAVNVNAVAAKTDGLQLQNFSSMLQPAHATAGAAGAAATATGSAKATGDDAPVSIANVAVEVTSKIASGKNQFDIRLDPPDLGKIHVKVNVDRDGNVITHMVADRTDTLDLLRRDTSDLQRALQDAGLKTSDNSLQFSLRDQTANQQQGQQQGQVARLAADDDQTTTSTATIVARDYGAYGSRTGGLDIRV